MKLKIFKNRLFLTILISILIMSFLLVLTNIFTWINQSLRSFILKTKNEIVINNSKYINEHISNDIVVISIDDGTYNKFGFPFPRWNYIKLIENLNNAWAEIIWFDIMFADNNPTDLTWDNEFADAIQKAWNIILWSAVISKNFDWEILDVIERPLAKFLDWAISYWFFQPYVDKETNTVSSFIPVSTEYDDAKNIRTFNHFSISVLKAYYEKVFNKDLLSFEKRDNYYYYLRPDYPIPYLKPNDSRILISFIPTPKSWENKLSKFTTISFNDIYDNNFNPELIKNKIVIVWVTAKWIKDTFNTPNWIEYWVFIHANIINTILTKSYLIFFNYKLELILIFLLVLLSVYFNLSSSSYTLILSNISITFIFLFIFPFYILIFTNYVLNNLFELFLALLMSLIISNIVKFIIENKDKIKLNNALSEYVSKDIAKEIISNEWNINLNWERKKVAMYFSDIEWFTSISEKMKAEELVSFLREFLSWMSDIILDEKWFINKYEWDAIMALWWVFLEYNNSAHFACMTALKQQEFLKEQNIIWKQRKIPKIKVRVWLHSWDAIVWNIGSKGRKMEFTALGDNVNLASRLEWVNKFYWTYICVSENIYKECKNDFEFRYLDTIKVKWKDKAVKIYELLSIKWKLNKKTTEIVNKFYEWIELYKNKNFEEALIIFKELDKKWDNPSKTYYSRCEYFIKNPPKNWDAIWVMDSK